ncbi:MAG TPA: DUF2892 domain-containing protein [Gammaproteobacteria bacterium]|nr:DUF2892 domain-containing protein [Gammaproteobacteria bacterium]
MTNARRIAFGFIDRISRAFIGIVMVIFSFTYAINSEMFAAMQFFAMYPIFTALVAWDPVYALLEAIKQYWFDYSILHR